MSFSKKINTISQLTKYRNTFVVLSLLLSLLNIPFVNATSIELKVIKGVQSQQRTTQYFHQVLSEALALNKSNRKYILNPVDFEFPQNRTLKLLNLSGVLDITYSMTSSERELEFIPIKVPLLNGLFGKRQLLVAAGNKKKFETLNKFELQKLVACQGLHWPDYKRMLNNGYAVYGVNDYEANFKMLIKGRCDYFPRGLAEIELDFNKYNGRYGKLSKVNNIMLKYEAPIYFFVGKGRNELAADVEFGLLKMQKSGQLQQMLLDSNAFNYDTAFEKRPDLKVFQLK